MIRIYDAPIATRDISVCHDTQVERLCFLEPVALLSFLRNNPYERVYFVDSFTTYYFFTETFTCFYAIYFSPLDSLT